VKVWGYSSNLFGWRERFKKDGREPEPAALLADCKEAGLDAVEPLHAMDVYPHLEAAGLRISGHYVGLQLHEPWDVVDVEQRLLPWARKLAEAGGTDLILNADPIGSFAAPQAKTNDQIRRQGENMTRIARLAAPLGLRTAMHNHATVRALAEADLISVIEHSGPEVGLCVDTGWAHTAGCDPARWILGYPQRVVAVHFRNQHGPVPAEDLLEGEVDVRAVVEALREIGYEGWLALELWHREDTRATRTMIEDVRRSIGYLKELVGPQPD
jgi:inosose dehydratase